MTIAVSVLEVASPAVWRELEALVPLAPHVEGALSSTRRVVRRSFVREALPKLRDRGQPVLVRFASASQRTEAPLDPPVLAGLGHAAMALLHRIQRRMHDGTVLGASTWDPVGEARLVDALTGAGVLQPIPNQAPPRFGPYRVHPGLPAPPAVPYDFADALFPAPDDLEPAAPSPDALLARIGTLAAGLGAVPVRRTLAGTLERASVRRLGARLGLGKVGALADAGAGWARAWALAEGVRLFATDGVTRQITLEPGLEAFLAGSRAERLDRLVRRVVEPELHPLLPAVQAALRQAGTDAIDDVVWLELIAEQHRDVLFSPWGQVGQRCYPAGPGEAGVPFDDERFALIEGRLAHELLAVCATVGLVRRAPGAFAATDDGLAWSGATPAAAPPIWVASDLEIVVPPGALAPAERYAVDRFARCTARDVVDRYRLERTTLADWLRSASVDDAVALLTARAPVLPQTVVETLRSWARSIERVVLVHGVLLDALPSDMDDEEVRP